jgi:ABC-type transport system involved in multi-copper enzyme maturation permease subunit
MSTISLDRVQLQPQHVQTVPLSRVVGVELRKMFDTRAGLWLMASILLTALISTIATITFAPKSDLTYYTFAKAIGFPMTVILPIIAILAITSEWSQRTGLTTFTLVPHRTRVITAKIVASILVGVASMLIALVFGVAGNVIGPAITGTDRVWDVSFAHGLDIILGSLISLLLGTMLGILFRSTPVALVAYFVTSFLLPTVFGLLATNQERFGDLQRWVDLNYAQSFLFEGTLSGVQWARLAVATTLWLVLPALLGLRLVMKSEVR